MEASKLKLSALTVSELIICVHSKLSRQYLQPHPALLMSLVIDLTIVGSIMVILTGFTHRLLPMYRTLHWIIICSRYSHIYIYLALQCDKCYYRLLANYHKSFMLLMVSWYMVRYMHTSFCSQCCVRGDKLLMTAANWVFGLVQCNIWLTLHSSVLNLYQLETVVTFWAYQL